MRRPSQLESNPTYITVVAARLVGAEGLWLMHRRPMNKDHGGLWEFPGGKVEAGERPRAALVRELREELRITVSPDDCEPICFAETGSEVGGNPIVILLYTVSRWAGIPVAMEGGEIDWVSPSAVSRLDLPPLDRQLLARLQV